MIYHTSPGTDKPGASLIWHVFKLGSIAQTLEGRFGMRGTKKWQGTSIQSQSNLERADSHTCLSPALFPFANVQSIHDPIMLQKGEIV